MQSNILERFVFGLFLLHLGSQIGCQSRDVQVMETQVAQNDKSPGESESSQNAVAPELENITDGFLVTQWERLVSFDEQLKGVSCRFVEKMDNHERIMDCVDFNDGIQRLHAVSGQPEDVRACNDVYAFHLIQNEKREWVIFKLVARKSQAGEYDSFFKSMDPPEGIVGVESPATKITRGALELLNGGTVTLAKSEFRDDGCVVCDFSISGASLELVHQINKINADPEKRCALPGTDLESQLSKNHLSKLQLVVDPRLGWAVRSLSSETFSLRSRTAMVNECGLQGGEIVDGMLRAGSVQFSSQDGEKQSTVRRYENLEFESKSQGHNPKCYLGNWGFPEPKFGT